MPPTTDSERRFDDEIAELTAQTRRLTNQAHSLSRGIEMTLEELLTFADELATLSAQMRRRHDDDPAEEPRKAPPMEGDHDAS